MKKYLAFCLLFLILLTTFGCRSIDSEPTLEPSCRTGEIEIDGGCYSQFEVDASYRLSRLASPRVVDLSQFEYLGQGGPIIPYVDNDDRTLFPLGTLHGTAEVVFPDSDFHESVREGMMVSKDEPILYRDITSEQLLWIGSEQLQTIAGIEHFRNLRKLTIVHSPKLTSIRGVEKLAQLKELHLYYIPLKFFELQNETLEVLILNGTLVNLDASDITDLMNNLPNLRRIYLENTPTKITRSILEAVELVSSTRETPLMIYVDYQQIDWHDLDIDDFLLIDDNQELVWLHQNFSIRNFAYLNENSKMTGRFIDLTRSDFSEKFSTLMTHHMNRIDVLETMSDLEKTILVYDYWVDYVLSFDFNADSSNDIIAFMEKKETTVEAAFEVLALWLKAAGVHANANRWSVHGFGSDTGTITENGVFVHVVIDDVTYAINSYEALLNESDDVSDYYRLFMVGKDTLETYLDETYNIRNGFYDPFMFIVQWYFYDYDRDNLRETSLKVGIDIRFNETQGT